MVMSICIPTGLLVPHACGDEGTGWMDSFSRSIPVNGGERAFEYINPLPLHFS